MYIPYQHLQKKNKESAWKKNEKTCGKLYNSDKVQKKVSNVKEQEK